MSKLNSSIMMSGSTPAASSGSFQTSSLLNLFNISQQFSSPSLLPYGNLNDNFYSSNQTQQQQQQFPFSIFSQFCSQLKTNEDETDRLSPQSLLRSKQAKCSNLEKSQIYQ